jgi:mono/diheme cytochrome c family protein
MRWVAALFSLVFAVALATTVVDAQKRGGDPKLAARKNPVPSSPASINLGRALYMKNCRHCHGLRAKGDGPLAPKNPSPADLTDAKWDHGSSDGEIFAVIWNGAPTPAAGKKESEMKGMKGTLTEKDVWQVVNYIRSIGPAPAPAAKAAAKK